MYTVLGGGVVCSLTHNHYINICPVKQIEGKSVQSTLHTFSRSFPALCTAGRIFPRCISSPRIIYKWEWRLYPRPYRLTLTKTKLDSVHRNIVTYLLWLRFVGHTYLWFVVTATKPEAVNCMITINDRSVVTVGKPYTSRVLVCVRAASQQGNNIQIYLSETLLRCGRAGSGHSN